MTEANITDSAVHPEARIIPNALSKVSIFWRDVEDYKAFPSICPIETLETEKTRIAVLTARRR